VESVVGTEADAAVSLHALDGPVDGAVPPPAGVGAAFGGVAVHVRVLQAVGGSVRKAREAWTLWT